MEADGEGLWRVGEDCIGLWEVLVAIGKRMKVTAGFRMRSGRGGSRQGTWKGWRRLWGVCEKGTAV